MRGACEKGEPQRQALGLGLAGGDGEEARRAAISACEKGEQWEQVLLGMLAAIWQRNMERSVVSYSAASPLTKKNIPVGVLADVLAGVLFVVPLLLVLSSSSPCYRGRAAMTRAAAKSTEPLQSQA